jgi:hypothetical protein
MTVQFAVPGEVTETASARADLLASRLENGIRALVQFARTLSTDEWFTRVPHDGRKIGVVVNHVATMLPIEIDVAQAIARGVRITDLTWDVIHALNAENAKQFDGVTRQEAIDLLRVNGEAAAAAIRELTDEQLDTAVLVSLYADAPLTCQFMLEDHAVRHSYHHLAKIRKTLGR